MLLDPKLCGTPLPCGACKGRSLRGAVMIPWAKRIDARRAAVQRQAANLQKEIAEKLEEVRGYRAQVEREIQPSAMRDEFIADIEALERFMTTLAGV